MGVENPRLYSETYYGTKHLAQDFIDDLEKSLAYLLHSSQLTQPEKYYLAKQLHTNLGRTALCLSGGASFAWYHFGVVKALLDAQLVPDVVTGSRCSTVSADFLSFSTHSADPFYSFRWCLGGCTDSNTDRQRAQKPPRTGSSLSHQSLRGLLSCLGTALVANRRPLRQSRMGPTLFLVRSTKPGL